MISNVKEKPPILVTGSHRSGTTIVGKILSVSRSIGYIPEPFNVDYGIEGVNRWFPYIRIDAKTEPYYDRLIKHLVNGKSKYKRTEASKEDPLYKKVAHKFIRSRAHVNYKKAIWDPVVKRLLIKDPLAVLSSDWMNTKHNMSVVVLVRHPAAFVSSLKRLNWSFDFNNFVDQPDLMNDHLEKVLDIENIGSKNLIEQSSYLWLCIYEVVKNYLEQNQNLILVRHEDVSNKPFKLFRELYGKLTLNFTGKVKRAIEKHMSSVNPVEAQNGEAFQLRRDSNRIIDVWKNRLSSGELETVERVTRSLAEDYYKYKDWDL